MRRSILLLLLLAGCSSPPQATDSVAAAPAAEDDSFSERELESIRGQIYKNWSFDPGLPGIETMEALVIIEMNPDGSVQSVRYDPTSIRDDPNWKLFAESCRRAVLDASPLQMPPDRPYAAWKRIFMGFDVRPLTGLN